MSKVVIVTGGASGIGEATVERLAREGWSITIADVNETAGNALMTRLKEAGVPAQFVRTDVREEASVADMVRRTLEASGRSMPPSTVRASRKWGDPFMN